MGQRPVPTVLKILRGNPGKKRLPREPKPERTDATPPPDLAPGALAIWQDHAPELARLGLLTVIDRRRLATACRLQALGDAYGATAEEQVAVKGRLVRPSPALWAAVKCWVTAGAIWGDFGVTPIMRARLGNALLPQREPAKSKWDGLLTPP